MIGIAIIVFSLLLALGAWLDGEENISTVLLIVTFIPLPLYLLGHLVRTSWAEFKQKYKRWTGLYVFGVMIVPFILHSQESYAERKWNAISDGKFIYYQGSSGDLGVLSGFLMMTLILMIMGYFFNPGLKSRKWLTVAILGTTLFYAGFQYVMWNDYRGIHEEKGLITHTWSGKRTVQPFDDITGIFVQPDFHKGRLSDPTDESEFRWKLIFIDRNGGNTVYHFQSLSKDALDIAIQVKDLAYNRHIPFQVREMDKKTLDMFDFELELKDLEKEPFYRFFGVEEHLQ